MRLYLVLAALVLLAAFAAIVSGETRTGLVSDPKPPAQTAAERQVPWALTDNPAAAVATKRSTARRESRSERRSRAQTSTRPESISKGRPGRLEPQASPETPPRQTPTVPSPQEPKPPVEVPPVEPPVPPEVPPTPTTPTIPPLPCVQLPVPAPPC